MRYQHEQAYLLAKGDVVPPTDPLSDVMDFPYSRNRLHPTQKPVQALEPLIRAFCKPDGIVLDPFADRDQLLSPPEAQAVVSLASSLTESIF